MNGSEVVVSKPSLFVGSSSEGLPFAEAVRSALDRDAEVTLWNEGFFVLGQTFIEALVTQLPRFDFGVLVLTGDDFVVSRDIGTLGPRDNVLFELGLFMGRLGRERTFVLHQAAAGLKLPSDLSGLVTATYQWPRSDENHHAAVGSACTSIRKQIRDLGVSDAKTAGALKQVRSRQEKQEAALANQQTQIRSLQIVVQGIVTKYEYDKLAGLAREEPFMCYFSEDLIAELKRLRAMGFVQHHEGTGLRGITVEFEGRDAQFDLKRFFAITPQGREYMAMRDAVLPRT